MAFKLSKLIKGDGPGRVQSIESIGGDGTPRLPDVAIIDSFPALNYPYHEQELQECRLELLTTIHQLQVTREPTQDILETIRIKKAHHNHIVDSINELQARYRLDPIEKLPPELFISIIQEATFDAIPCDPLYLYSYIVGGLVIVRLTLVSRRWKELITNTPIFWTSIVLDGKSPQNFPNPLKFFELSRQLPVSVSIVYSVTMENSASWQELLKNRDRIVRLFYEDEFRGATRVEHDFKATFRNFMRNLSPLPALESLQYSSSTPHCDGPTIQYALDLCPTLRDIWAPLLPEKQIQYLMSRNCRIINVGQSPEPLWPFLEANSSLRNVRCYQGFSEEGTLPIVTKPLNWEMLSVDHLNVPLSIGITEKITQLVELNIGGYFSALFQLLTNIHRLSRLQALGLTLSINGDMAIIEHLPTSFPSNSTVEKLRFYLDFEWKDQPGKFVDDNVPIGFAERQKIDEFGGLMIQSFPMIWDLSLFLSALPGIDFLSEVFDLRKANHLSCLQRLYISSEFVIDSSELPPCDTLKVHCENRDDLIRLSNRKTRHLTMDSGYSGKVERNLRYRSWPSLETLTIPTCLISSAETGFPYLREIILNTKSASGSITKFCRRLAPHPNLCPALETLSIDEFPEWDIFFIMLERRLLLGAKGATAFKYITLPASSPLNLLHHVCEILQGRLPDRPSNFDLSLLSKTKALLDETITSCLRCIRSDRRCQNTSLRPMELPSEQERSKWIRSLPKYPQNEDHILWTWKKRSRAWNKGVSLAKFRVEKCDHSTYGSIRLDQFTSLDVDVK